MTTPTPTTTTTTTSTRIQLYNLVEATAGFGTEVHQPVDSSHDDKKNNNKNENITSNDKKHNHTFIDAEDHNQTMEAMTMVVTAMVNDENSQVQETITSCDHVKNCQE